ncbi:MAG TPA: 23S rRNA (guanosine(2251)-2'-O)-methyltransferase RlmB [Tenericutes bacterium]|jgi:23S rRNA (guanosine2251-2'-O)-methyltransferase|nr:23S rRNA (guanosine(2251)-2'-O)-methyltransferase RlmB [Mycoplasmatota bacterium]
MEYIYGKNSVLELLNTDWQIYEIMVSRTLEDKKLIDFLKSKKVKLTFCDKKELDDLVSGNHQGIVAKVEDFKYVSLEEILENKKGIYNFIVILDHIEDPHNLGAILRTVEAVGADGVIIPKDRSVKVNPTVLKTSVGAALHVPICIVSNLNDTIHKLKKVGIWIVGTSAKETSVHYQSIDYKMNLAVVIGNEGKGLSDLVRKKCDFLIKIPMKGKINSLNASVATGVILYEVLRQRETQGGGNNQKL